MTTITAQGMATAIREAIPAQLDRAGESCTYTAREMGLYRSFMGKVTVRPSGERMVTLRCPAWRGSQWQARLTWLIDRAIEDMSGIQETGHILDVDATTTTFTW